MKFIKVLTVMGLSLLSFFSNAKPAKAPQIEIRSELAAPIVLANSQDKNYLKISLTGVEFDSEKRAPINLAIVIDRSGSMSGDRIEKAREAAILAINMLQDNDVISVIAYDSVAEVIIPATKVKNKQQLIKIINTKVQADGATALFAGLSKGINQVEKHLSRENVNRVILLSDGHANVGPTSVGELSELAIIAAKKGITITTIGLGNGYNEMLMSSIAGYSDGNHAFVNNSADLENVFSRELKDVMSVVAQDVVITVHLKEGVKPVRLLGRDGIIKDNQVIIKMKQLYSNQEKYVLLEVQPAKGKAGLEEEFADVELNYDNPITNKIETGSVSVNIAYTDQPEIVEKSLVEDVLAESEIQKATLANDEALELYNQGKVAEAKQIMEDNRDKLNAISNRFYITAPEASERLKSAAEKNAEFADSIDKEDAETYNKSMTESQYKLKQNSIQK